VANAPVTPARASASKYPRTVFVGSEPLVAAWSASVGEASEVTPITLKDLPITIEAIDAAQPDVVVIEQALAGSGPGLTLMDRLHGERYVRGLEVRLLPPDRAADVMSSACPGELDPHAWLTVLAQALPARPERRATRIDASNEQAFIDGHAVTLIDLSAVGAQVRSPIVLRPRQRVRLVLPPERGSVRAVAVVAWSSFEIVPTPSYRAGVAFTRAIPEPV
jgi:hypothetical protein